MPSLANAWHNLGLALNAQDRFAEAETALRRGLDLAPDKADMWNNLATTLQHLGRVPEAILALERALQLWPTFDLARHNLRRLRDRQAAVASAAPKEKSPGAKVCPEILA
jgi:tetratricopeptide (TPR) repeat protein